MEVYLIKNHCLFSVPRSLYQIITLPASKVLKTNIKIKYYSKFIAIFSFLTLKLDACTIVVRALVVVFDSFERVVHMAKSKRFSIAS